LTIRGHQRNSCPNAAIRKFVLVAPRLPPLAAIIRRQPMKFEFDPHRALTQKEYKYLEHMSPSKYHGLKNKGLGPKETDIDGMLRILPEDRQAWHERMAEHAEDQTTQLQADPRRAT